MRKIKMFFSAIIIGVITISIFYKNGMILDLIGMNMENPFVKKVNVPPTYIKVDNNKNGIPDPLDIVQTARIEVAQRTINNNPPFAAEV